MFWSFSTSFRRLAEAVVCRKLPPMPLSRAVTAEVICET